MPNANGVDEKVDEHVVRADKEQKDAEIAPLLTLVHIECCKIVVADTVGAVFAVLGRGWVEKIAWTGICKCAGVLLACLARRSVEVGCLRRRASDRDIV